MEEIWKDIPSYEGIYQISNIGRVRNLEYYIIESTGKRRKRRARIISNKLPEGAEYYQVILFKNKKSKLWRIHRLVAIAFISNPENLREINHKDHNKLNNSVDNLEWCSHSYNNFQSVEFHEKYGENLYNAKLTEEDVRNIRKRLDEKEPSSILSVDYKVSKTTIDRIRQNKIWKRVK